MSNFSSFVDHYILLLAARYHAPLEHDAAEALDDDAEGSAAWQQVSRALQHALHGPLSVEERKEMRLVDVSFFTAPLVRQRALYLRWHHAQKVSRKRREKQAAARPGFDVTRDSIKTDVEAIYALVRAQLPSTVVLTNDALDSEEEEGEETVDENKIQRSHANPEAAGLAPVELPAFMQTTAAERQRDAAFSLARDSFLTTIQKLQAEFYQTHRRWVDVPADILEPPTGPAVGARAAVDATPPSNKRPSLQEERERLELLVALNSGGGSSSSKENARDSYKADEHAAGDWRAGGQNPRDVVASVRERLMRATNAAEGGSGAKPIRPSAMTNEEMERYYTAQTTPNLRTGRADTNMNGRAPSGVASAVKPVSGAAGQAAAAAAAGKDTTPPAGRNRRWQVMEYTETNDNEENTSSSSSASSSSGEEEEEE